MQVVVIRGRYGQPCQDVTAQHWCPQGCTRLVSSHRRGGLAQLLGSALFAEEQGIEDHYEFLSEQEALDWMLEICQPRPRSTSARPGPAKRPRPRLGERRK